MIVLDTSVLSLAFRRRATGEGPPPAVEILRRLIVEDASLVIHMAGCCPLRLIPLA